MPAPSFATPLPQSARSEILEWRFPKPFHSYVLTGRSRAAWHTSFVIPQLNLLLDAGLVINRLRPKHVFLTHGHSDHTQLAPVFVTSRGPPDVFCPAAMAPAFDAFIRAQRLLDQGGLVTAEEYAAARGSLVTHVTHGLEPGDVVPLAHLKGSGNASAAANANANANAITATAFACDHTVPCLGYVFSTTTQRLRPEYVGRTGAELRALREESGVSITAPVTVPVFAFLGDTTPAPLLADSAGWLREGIAVVVTECSFLHEEHRAQAAKTKHTLWADLEPVVRAWPRTTFVLTHFSMRYSDDDVRRFFAGLSDCPKNIVVWVDGLDPDSASEGEGALVGVEVSEG
ncbi:RNase Z [Lasiosphaeria ovina]|uniref:RNase Z n=1 Tax=Lasiosphaeria ovina TaxID=92902 RepID=A0AAE0NDU7_9PEZI|nr:RNase Z [Lasiosphaeria ovina]